MPRMVNFLSAIPFHTLFSYIRKGHSHWRNTGAGCKLNSQICCWCFFFLSLSKTENKRRRRKEKWRDGRMSEIKLLKVWMTFQWDLRKSQAELDLSCHIGKKEKSHSLGSTRIWGPSSIYISWGTRSKYSYTIPVLRDKKIIVFLQVIMNWKRKQKSLLEVG